MGHKKSIWKSFIHVSFLNTRMRTRAVATTVAQPTISLILSKF